MASRRTWTSSRSTGCYRNNSAISIFWKGTWILSAGTLPRRQLERNAALVIQALRKIAIDQVHADLVQSALHADVMQRSTLHPVTQSLNDAVILESDQIERRFIIVGNAPS